MDKREPTKSYTVAEVLVAAPWTQSILARNCDNTTAKLLHCIRHADPMPRWPDQVDHFALERQARGMRADYVTKVCRAAWEKLARGFRAAAGKRQALTYVRGRKIVRAFDAD